MHKIATVHLILMSNTLAFKDSTQIDKIFDLKGSTVARETKITKETKPTETLKDLNFLKIARDEGIINFMTPDIQNLTEIIKIDSEFCRTHGLMDYSLLLSVEKFGAKTLRGDELTLKLVVKTAMNNALKRNLNRKSIKVEKEKKKSNSINESEVDRIITDSSSSSDETAPLPSAKPVGAPARQ